MTTREAIATHYGAGRWQLTGVISAEIDPKAGFYYLEVMSPSRGARVAVHEDELIRLVKGEDNS